MAKLTIGTFAGFPRDAFRFYAELAQEGNNDRAWFDDNRHRYERGVRLPLEERLDRAAEEFGTDGHVFRPERLTLSRSWPVRRWMHTAAAYDQVAGLWRASLPIGRWLQRHVGAAAEPDPPRGGSG